MLATLLPFQLQPRRQRPPSFMMPICLDNLPARRECDLFRDSFRFVLGGGGGGGSRGSSGFRFCCRRWWRRGVCSSACRSAGGSPRCHVGGFVFVPSRGCVFNLVVCVTALVEQFHAKHEISQGLAMQPTKMVRLVPSLPSRRETNTGRLPLVVEFRSIPSRRNQSVVESSQWSIPQSRGQVVRGDTNIRKSSIRMSRVCSVA